MLPVESAGGFIASAGRVHAPRRGRAANGLRESCWRPRRLARRLRGRAATEARPGRGGAARGTHRGAPELEKRGRELAAERSKAQAAVRKRETVLKRNEALEEEVAARRPFFGAESHAIAARRLESGVQSRRRSRRRSVCRGGEARRARAAGLRRPDVIEARRETKEALGKAADLAREAARVATHLAGARSEGDAAKAELTDLKIKLAAAVEASTVEKRKSFAAAKNAEAARAQLLKQITRADALAAGKASADAAAAHSKRVAERAKDAAHRAVSRAASEFARYRAAVEARLRDTAPPPPSAFERMGRASARHLRKKRVLSPAARCPLRGRPWRRLGGGMGGNMACVLKPQSAYQRGTLISRCSCNFCMHARLLVQFGRQQRQELRRAHALVVVLGRGLGLRDVLNDTPASGGRRRAACPRPRWG